MKKFGQLFMLFAVASLALSACNNGDENENGALGSVTFDGKRIGMKAPIFEENNSENTDRRVFADRWKKPEDTGEFVAIKEYTIGITSNSEINADLDKITSFYFTTSLPQEDFELDLSSYSTDFCYRIYFLSGGKLYISRLSAAIDRIYSSGESRATYTISSMGIDPETGSIYIIGKEPGTESYYSNLPEFGHITGGSLRVKWSAETVRFDFNLKLNDGKTAKGYGEIPREMIVL